MKINSTCTGLIEIQGLRGSGIRVPVSMNQLDKSNLPEKAKSTELVALSMRHASVDASFGRSWHAENPLFDANKVLQLCAENATPKSAPITTHSSNTSLPPRDPMSRR